MKKYIKSIAKVTLMVIACISFILMFGEREDGSICLWWNLGWMAVFAICAKILDKLGTFKKYDHVEV